ncbi:MAG: hypothetical protein J6Y37_02225 [Paludibacteraceae bacterium]|nr:hypothetical protein [Paludibacteraceae bacterium]
MKLFKIISILVLCVVLALAGVIYYRYYFVFGTGIKSGELNQIVLKGNLFKTYEGRLIQSGFKGTQANTIQSYEFNFSVEDEKVAKRLERLGRKSLELHYNEYKHVLPWRGNSVYIVDSIVSIIDEEPDYGLEKKSTKKKRVRKIEEDDEEEYLSDAEEEEEYDEVFKSLEYYEKK